MVGEPEPPVQAGLDYKPKQRIQTRCPYRQNRRVLASCAAIERLVAATPDRRLEPLMLTLTYGDLDAWAPNHVRTFLTALRNWYRRHTDAELRYVWVLEMQKRGAVHYHVMLWVPEGLRLPFPDEGIRTPWWPHGHSNLKRNIRHHGAYLAKYIGKGNRIPVPHCARTFGSSYDEPVRLARRWASAPGYVRAIAPRGDRLTRHPRVHVPAGYRLRANDWLGTRHFNGFYDRLCHPVGDAYHEAGFWLAHDSGIYLLPIHRHRYETFRHYRLRGLFGFLGCNLRWTPPSDRTIAAMLDLHPDAMR